MTFFLQSLYSQTEEKAKYKCNEVVSRVPAYTLDLSERFQLACKANSRVFFSRDVPSSSYWGNVQYTSTDRKNYKNKKSVTEGEINRVCDRAVEDSMHGCRRDISSRGYKYPQFFNLECKHYDYGCTIFRDIPDRSIPKDPGPTPTASPQSNILRWVPSIEISQPSSTDWPRFSLLQSASGGSYSRLEDWCRGAFRNKCLEEKRCIKDSIKLVNPKFQYFRGYTFDDVKLSIQCQLTCQCETKP